MSELATDFRTVMDRLSALEDELHQLRKLLTSQSMPKSSSGATDHPHITRVKGVLSGEPIVKGTRTPVRAIVEHWKFGDTPEEIVRKLPHLRLAEVFDALSYYDDHREDIERAILLNRIPADA